jgi:ribosomal 50S subunit-associated protein YjgA (DUF615 family)
MIVEELRIIQNDVKGLSEFRGDVRRIEETLVRIEKQVTTTNGRVNNLETWRNRIIGAVSVISGAIGYLAMSLFH